MRALASPLPHSNSLISQANQAQALKDVSVQILHPHPTLQSSYSAFLSVTFHLCVLLPDLRTRTVLRVEPVTIFYCFQFYASGWGRCHIFTFVALDFSSIYQFLNLSLDLLSAQYVPML